MDKLYLFFLLIIFSGCKKELQIQNKRFEAQNFLHEAKHFDLPIPFNASPISNKINENSYCFTTNHTIEDLIAFYDSEMENYGWKKILQFDSFEKLLIFEKPNKFISISIRENYKESYVYIFFINN